MYKNIILSVVFSTLASCNTQNSTKNQANTGNSDKVNSDIQRNKEENIIYFNEGENKFLKEYEMNVTFKGISEDSRCPKDVNCVWAGAAVAQVEVIGLATRPVILNLSTMDNAGRNYFKSAEFIGYTISLEELTPYPDAKNSSKALKGNYKIAISIKKTGEKPTIR